MLQRAFIHICLILLFAVTQMGVATHEISHLTDKQQQRQEDNKHPQNQCEQCLTISHAANAPLAHSVVFVTTSTKQFYTFELTAGFPSRTATPYSARAPPSLSQI
jgi:hypothetical protein